MAIAVMIAFLVGVSVGFVIEFLARWAAWREIESAQDVAFQALKQAGAAREAARIILDAAIERVVEPERSE